MKTIAICTALCLASLLAGCTDTDRMPEGMPAPHAGDAVHRNIAAQLTNPQAPVSNKALTMNGERADAAQTRYAADKVIKPDNVSTDTGTGGNGNGGNSGGTSTGGGSAATQ